MIGKLRRNPHKLNLFLDLALVIAFAIEMEEHFTGIRNHELLGLTFGLAVLIHLILHWDWVVSVTKRFFNKVIHESRLNYVLNVALFVDMVVVIATGILISRTLGLNLGHNDALQPIHLLASYLSLIIVGLHVALHWKWIVTHAPKYLLPVRLFRSSAAVKPSQISGRDKTPAGNEV